MISMVLKFFSLIALSFLLSSCGNLSYLTEQGYQQMRLQWRGRDNDEVLQDPKVSEDQKRKILLIGEYKKFFYHYFDKKQTSIYSKTSMLDNKAVTYLVIASSHTKIEAHEFEFPFVGSFPYIGFFKKDSAKDFAKDLEKEDYVTWIRPVYAYSTLGYLEDRILSSFFHYDDVELAELIFHELFHTVFFIEDEVDLNENLASLFARDLLFEYFKDRPELKSYLKLEEKKKLVNQRIVELIGILQTEFAKLGGFITKDLGDTMTKRFVTEIFKPEIKNLCSKLEIPEDECEMKEDWNQAAFAAFMTYEEDQKFLEKLRLEKKLGLKEFFNWLKVELKDFEKNKKKDETFTDRLKSKVSHAPAPSH
jgi:Putative aminopeptidase